MVSNNRPYQLLFADDDRAFRETLRMLFSPHFEMIEACSGEEAIELAGRISFDLVLLDMHMEELTGLETLRVIKTIHVEAPCILITGDATTELEAEATDDGAYSVLKKPVRKAELITTISTALQDAYDDGDYLSALL